MMRRPRDEQGSVLPMMVLLLTVLLGFTAFAVDLGLHRVAIRDMQALADTAALDTARHLPSCEDSILTAAANDSRARHGTLIGEGRDLDAVPGHIDSVTREFVAGASSDGVCDAVQVSAGTTVGFAFAPGEGDAERAAVATRDDPSVCFSVGTKTLTLDTSESALGPALDHILKANLDVVGYEGLVDLQEASVPLLDLSVELGAGSANELLELSDLSLGDFMIATAAVLSRNGNAVQATILQSIAAQVSHVTVDIAQILDLGTGGDAALNATVNALDLVGVAIVAANGTNSVAVQDIGVSLGSLASAAASVVITEPPQIGCGTVGATARSAQVKVQLAGELDALGVTGVELDLGVTAGNGAATLTSLSCTDPAAVTVSATTSAASIVGDGTDPARLELTVLDGGLLGGLLGLLARVNVTVNLGGDIGAGGPYERTLTYPAAPGLPATERFSGGESLNLDVIDIDMEGRGLLGGVVSVAGRVVEGITSELVTPLINDVVGPLLDSILKPLLETLGVKLGVTEVQMLGRPECRAVKLAG